MDGEAVGEVLYAFDLLELDGEDLRSKTYQQRHLVLMNLMARARQRNIVFAGTAFTPKQKRQMLERLRKQNKEGLVFKRWDAPYTPGRPSSGGAQLKHKFYATLSAVVSKTNGDKRSVELRLLNCKGWLPCGNVTIPANFQVPAVGQVVEIRYLYAFKESNALYQPVYLGPRQDVEQHECVLSQLKYKAGGEEDEAC
jgi:bifunctional non-homologous end joining protein LigD